MHILAGLVHGVAWFRRRAQVRRGKALTGAFASLHDVVQFYNKGRGNAVPKDMHLYLHWHISDPKLTDTEVDRIVDLVREGLALGAVGFSTDQCIGNFGPGLEALPGQVCARTELLAIADALGAAADFGKLKPQAVSFEGHDAQYVEDGPTTLLTWQEHDLHFALVSDLVLRDLVDIATSVVP